MVHAEAEAAEWLLRLADVKRWGIVPTTREQSVAEHSFNVWCIARHLHKVATANAPSQVMTELPMVEKWALVHDADEVETGDLPSSLKQNNQDLKKALRRAQDVALMVGAPWVKVLKNTVEGTYVDLIVKIADCAEAMEYYSKYSAKTRPSEWSRVWVNMNARINMMIESGKVLYPERDWNGVEWFLRHLRVGHT